MVDRIIFISLQLSPDWQFGDEIVSLFVLSKLNPLSPLTLLRPRYYHASHAMCWQHYLKCSNFPRIKELDSIDFIYLFFTSASQRQLMLYISSQAIILLNYQLKLLWRTLTYIQCIINILTWSSTSFCWMCGTGHGAGTE